MKWADLTDLLLPEFIYPTWTLMDLEFKVPAFSGPPMGTVLHPFRRFEFPWVFNVLKPYVKDPELDVVLEVGPGRTLLQALIATQVHQVVSVDHVPDSSEWVQGVLVNQWGLNILPVQGDLQCLDFPDNHFDKVLCVSVVEHQPREKFQSAVDELLRVTKPGGHLAITMDITLGSGGPPACNNQVQLEDLVRLAERYKFQVPAFPPHMMVMQNDVCLLTVAGVHIKKGWEVGDWERQ